MVFMGSEKYPAENHYDSYVSSHGGSCNAFTEGEYTVYQFDVSADYFAETLDIFAQCFISPLLSFSSATREVNAIESEFNLARMSDSTRMGQLFCHTAMDGHVIRKFGWGNNKSLVEVPRTKGVNMQEVLRDFCDTYYQPQCMKLVVLAPKTLDEIQRDVEASFESWAKSATQPSKKKIKGNESTEIEINFPMDEILHPFQSILPIAEQNISRLYRIVPMKKLNVLTFTWQLPSSLAMYKSKPLSYISHLIGHEGSGSLLSALKRLNFANEVYAGVSASNSSENTMFTLFAARSNLRV